MTTRDGLSKAVFNHKGKNYFLSVTHAEERLESGKVPEMELCGYVTDIIETKPSEYKSGIDIEKVIYNDPATVVFWSDGTKTVVKVENGEEYDPEKGLYAACAKKLLGNYTKAEKHLPKDDYDEVVVWPREYNTADELYGSITRAMSRLAQSCSYGGSK